jgi:hypothetical protein
LRIDFGDGNGWVYFDQSVVTNHAVVYPDSGNYAVTVQIVQGNAPNIIVINSAIFNKAVASGEEAVEPDFYIGNNGIRAGFFGACSDGPQAETDKKFVIYLEGFDGTDFLPGVNRNVSEIYSLMIKDSRLVELRNFGYTFIVIDWKNSREDIKDNAMSLVKFIDDLKCAYPESDHEFVLIGESMGGLIGRYALTFMETEDYQDGYRVGWSTVEPCLPELMHKTRLFMTFDTPHQGANIPLAYQWMYDEGASKIPIIAGYSPLSLTLFIMMKTQMLYSKSAKQMLIYHLDNKMLVSSSGNQKVYNYFPHNDRTDFVADLQEIGNYPRYCKLMALSNGSITSAKQRQDYYPFNARVANDVLLDLEGETYTRILGIKFSTYSLALIANSNPDGNGRLIKANADKWKFRIKLFWVGVQIYRTPVQVLNTEIVAANTKPWCTEAGGNIQVASSIPNTRSGDLVPFLLGLRWDIKNNGNGNYAIKVGLGFPWLVQNNADFTFYSNGLGFGFIPTASALDWGNLNTNTPNSPDIVDEPWPNKMNNTPFDVIASPGVNAGHLRVNNSTFGDRRNPIELVNCRLDALVLNREIGDEFLYLNNRILPWQSRFESELDIIVNEGSNNPHYFYDGINPVQFVTTGRFYSKQNPFIVSAANPVTNSSFFVDFRSETSLTYIPPYAPSSIQVNYLQEDVWICCKDASEYKQSPFEESSNSEELLRIYPNPFTSEFQAEILVKHSGNYQIVLLNASGKVLSKENVEIEGGTTSVKTFSNQLPPGLYFVQLIDSMGEIISNQKIVKQ